MAWERVGAKGTTSPHQFLGGDHRAEDCGMGRSICRNQDVQEHSEQQMRSKGSHFLTGRPCEGSLGCAGQLFPCLVCILWGPNSPSNQGKAVPWVGTHARARDMATLSQGPKTLLEKLIPFRLLCNFSFVIFLYVCLYPPSSGPGMLFFFFF